VKFDFVGLKETEVLQARQQHGSNAMTQQDVETFWDKFVENFKDPIILILVVALVVTVGLSIAGFVPWYEGVGIAIAVAVATLVATWSEYSNETEFQKLLEEASRIQVKVFRDGHLVERAIDDIVVGDQVLLQSGDNIPADGVLVGGAHLSVSEAALTGESEAIIKQPIKNESIYESLNRVSRAALVEDGEAVMTVDAVGDKTEYGKTLKEIVSAEARLSPLQEKLTVLGGQISMFGYIGASFIAVAFMISQVYFISNDAGIVAGSLSVYLDMYSMGEIVSHMVTALILAIIIVVVAVPEGLPMMIAIVLSLNMRKLLRAKVLVRKLLGIETAGSLTVLFTDKTGTLTQGRLSVETFISGAAQTYADFSAVPASLQTVLSFALRNNTSAVIDSSDMDDIRFVGADRTEQALLGFLGQEVARKDEIELVESISFSSARKFSAMQVSGQQALSLVKGAPEILLQQCSQYVDEQGEIQSLDKAALQVHMDQCAKDAMRLMMVAQSQTPLNDNQDLPDNLVLIGIFGIRDALRETSYDAVKTAQGAGIQVIMITGDAKPTAEAIARDVGLLQQNSRVINSDELKQMSDEEVKACLPDLAVVSRAYPTDKSRLVNLAKSMNWVVGMTGDGVNDAPAVKSADVGFAMGSGTEITKEASDIVILDDNFASITQAVLYGRTLFKSIQKFLIFQLTVNVAAILLAFLGPLMGYELPLTMIQLLWINIIMDTLAAIAFSGEAALPRYMTESPIDKSAPLINKDMWSSVLFIGISITAFSLFFLTSTEVKSWFRASENDIVFLTAFFGFFVFINNFNKFNARTESINLWDRLTDNKNFLWVVAIIFTVQILFTYIGGDVMRVVGLTVQEWLIILALSVLVIPLDLVRKFIRDRLNHA